MRVERRQHAVDGVLHQRLLVDRLDIVAADALQHVAEQVELLVELALVGSRLGRGLVLVLGKHGGQRHAGAKGHDRGGGSETETSHWLAFKGSEPGQHSSRLCGVFEASTQGY